MSKRFLKYISCLAIVCVLLTTIAVPAYAYVKCGYKLKGSWYDADVDFGIADKNGGFYYLEGENGSVSGSIEIPQNGTYTFAIRNNSDVSVNVTGFVKY